jgi:hypothetical protein
LDEQQHEQAEALAQAEAQLRLIAASVAGGLPVYLFGGYAHDALLAGGVTRPHHDVDYLAWRRDAGTIERAYRDLGYGVHPRVESGAARPYKLFVVGPALLADVVLLDWDSGRRRGSLDLEGRQGRRFRLYFEPSVFGWAPQRLGALAVHTASPLALLQAPAAVTAIGRFPVRVQDARSAEALRARFFPGRTLDDPLFQPEVVELT